MAVAAKTSPFINCAVPTEWLEALVINAIRALILGKDNVVA